MPTVNVDISVCSIRRLILANFPRCCQLFAVVAVVRGEKESRGLHHGLPARVTSTTSACCNVSERQTGLVTREPTHNGSQLNRDGAGYFASLLFPLASESCCLLAAITASPALIVRSMSVPRQGEPCLQGESERSRRVILSSFRDPER